MGISEVRSRLGATSRCRGAMPEGRAGRALRPRVGGYLYSPGVRIVCRRDRIFWLSGPRGGGPVWVSLPEPPPRRLLRNGAACPTTGRAGGQFFFARRVPPCGNTSTHPDLLVILAVVAA